MEKTIFVYVCPNCHKPISSRLERFKCWYCNTYFEDTKAWEIKEMTEIEFNAIQGRSGIQIINPETSVASSIANPTPSISPSIPQSPIVVNPTPSISSSIPQSPSTPEMLQSLNNKPWEFAWEKLASIWQGVIALIVVICVLSIFIEPNIKSTIQIIVGLLIGWFWTGPWCWKIAYEKGRNQTWAFAIGLFFAIFGAVIYWIYLLFFKPVNIIPIQR